MLVQLRTRKQGFWEFEGRIWTSEAIREREEAPKLPSLLQAGKLRNSSLSNISFIHTDICMYEMIRCLYLVHSNSVWGQMCGENLDGTRMSVN